MLIQIRLDSKALDVLFPEGSEARIELKDCLVAEFVRQALLPATEAAKAVIHSAAWSAARAEMAQAVGEAVEKAKSESTAGVHQTLRGAL